ncbi:SprT-like domain-containing protein, partial [Georgenia sp. 10Sc9-8]|nr:SprT-like domain-containing protein [Georgenia halotolerans]
IRELTMDLSEVRRLGEGLLSDHGLHGWTFGFDRAKRRAGQCRYDRRTITVSRTLMELYSPAEVRDTVLHEVAHALAGAEHGHDAVWRATARRIGCSGRRLVDQEAPRVPAPWVGRCPAGHEVQRHRRPSAPVSCSRCSRTFRAEHLIRWSFHGREVPMPASYQQQLAQLLHGPAPAAAQEDGPATRLLRAPRPVPVGTLVRVVVPGRYRGITGHVAKVGRTRYHVRTAQGVLTVPFAGTEPLDEWSADRAR